MGQVDRRGLEIKNGNADRPFGRSVFNNRPMIFFMEKNGCDIRTIQELLGHQKPQTMIYTHVASKNILGIRSPLDK
jgi:integrase